MSNLGFGRVASDKAREYSNNIGRRRHRWTFNAMTVSSPISSFEQPARSTNSELRKSSSSQRSPSWGTAQLMVRTQPSINTTHTNIKNTPSMMEMATAFVVLLSLSFGPRFRCTPNRHFFDNSPTQSFRGVGRLSLNKSASALDNGQFAMIQIACWLLLFEPLTHTVYSWQKDLVTFVTNSRSFPLRILHPYDILLSASSAVRPPTKLCFLPQTQTFCCCCSYC